MKLRHLIPWIPILGYVYILIFVCSGCVDDKDGNQINHVWGSEIAFVLSHVFQGLCIIMMLSS